PPSRASPAYSSLSTQRGDGREPARDPRTRFRRGTHPLALERYRLQVESSRRRPLRSTSRGVRRPVEGSQRLRPLFPDRRAREKESGPARQRIARVPEKGPAGGCADAAPEDLGLGQCPTPQREPRPL